MNQHDMTIAPDSSAYGYLQEVGTVLEDPELTDAITAAIVGITGIPANLVRPRWQPLPPNHPPTDVTWCAAGIVRREAMDYPWIDHELGTDGNGVDNMIDWTTLYVMVSFYGPLAATVAGKLRRGFYIEQNRDDLYKVGVKVKEVGDMQSVPDLVNMHYIDHVDVQVIMVRETTTQYKVRNIVAADVVTVTETVSLPYTVDDTSHG